MKCPVCSAAELIHYTRDLPYTYKGETTVIAAVTGDFCPACAESILDAAESNRVMREMRAFSKQVNAAIVNPSFIMNVHKKLDLDQREAAEIFGRAINAFSRYRKREDQSSRWNDLGAQGSDAGGLFHGSAFWSELDLCGFGPGGDALHGCGRQGRGNAVHRVPGPPDRPRGHQDLSDR